MSQHSRATIRGSRHARPLLGRRRRIREGNMESRRTWIGLVWVIGWVWGHPLDRGLSIGSGVIIWIKGSSGSGAI